MASTTNPKASNVLDLFNAIQRKRPADVEIDGNPGVEVVKSHIQGIAKHRDGYLLTHSDVRGDRGRLLVVDGRSNATSIRLPSFSLDGAVLNHPGGCQVSGDYLVIPFEAIEKNVSRVSVFDVSVPERPVELAMPAPIERHDRKAGAAGIASIRIAGTEFWYLAIYDNGRVDVHRSDGRPFPDTEFSPQFTKTIPDGYESFCLVAEETNRLFAIGFRLDSISRDKADLYAVHLDTEQLELLESKRFLTNGLLNVHFRWGGGLDIRSRDELAILATSRNFLPFLTSEITAGVPRGSAPPAADTRLLRPHCHVNTFAAT